MRKYNKILIYSKHVQKKKTPTRQKHINNHTAKKKMQCTPITTTF